MEVPPINMEDFNRWKGQQGIVKYSDMNDHMNNEAKDFVSTGIEKASGATGVNYQQACQYIKLEMDKQFGPSWHCIMGEGFSFEVTRQAGQTLHMYYAGKIAVLLFKC